MSWVLLGLLSSVFLGFYDIFKKVSLNQNAVFPTLFISVLAGGLLMIPFILVGIYGPQSVLAEMGYAVPKVSLESHLQIFIKSIIVTASWILSYLALRNLPITIVTPIRATGPMWTLIGAILIFGERLNFYQWFGILVTLTFFYLFSLAGKKEGIVFKNNIWIWCIVLGTIIGAISGLYDKFLLKRVDRLAVQAWFTVYQIFLLIPVIIWYWYPRRTKYPFKWRWSIPFIAVFLLIADFLYFQALSVPDSLISVISALRRSGVIIAFLFGAWLFKERNLKQKGGYLLGILLGIFILLFGSNI